MLLTKEKKKKKEENQKNLKYCNNTALNLI